MRDRHGAPGCRQDVSVDQLGDCHVGRHGRIVGTDHVRNSHAAQTLLEDELLHAGRCGVVQEPGDCRGPQTTDEVVALEDREDRVAEQQVGD